MLYSQKLSTNTTASIYLVRGMVEENPRWFYLQVQPDKIASFDHAVKQSSVSLTRYGKILFSGTGKEPPEEIKSIISKHYANS